MTRLLPFLVVLAVLPFTAAAAGLADLERVGEGYRQVQPGLQTYRVTVTTERIDALLRRAAAALPGGLPGKERPTVSKYWSRAALESVLMAEGPGAYPFVQELVERFSREFSVDPFTFFLPPGREEARRSLVGRAELRSSENLLGENRTVTLSLTFPEPVDLEGAFFGSGLDLPQQGVTALAFDLDPDRRLLRRLEVVSDESQLTVEVRHRQLEGGALPREILVTNPAGTVDDRFLTEYLQVGGFWLPGRQEFVIRRPGRSDNLQVIFTDYGINIPLPDQVRRRLEES